MPTFSKYLLCAALAALAGCASYETVTPPTAGPGPQPVIEDDDMVRIETTDGRKLKLKLTGIEEGALVSGETRVPFEDIRVIAIKRRNSVVHDTAWALGDLLTFAAFIYGFVLVGDAFD